LELEKRNNEKTGIMKTLKTTMMILLMAAITVPVKAQSDDLGLWTSVEATKKINKKFSVGAEGEFRLRDNFGAVGRWTVSVGAAYKPLKWLKFDAGYKFINDHETETYTSSKGNEKWLPYYWSNKHRVYAGVTGTFPVGDFKISLRERWQYTYRPEVTTECWNLTDGEQDDDKVKSGKGKNVLRSRLQLSYAIPYSNFEPYASAELYTSDRYEKMRYTAGCEWKINKSNSLELFYRYQDVHVDDGDSNENSHIIGLGYKFKF